MMKLTVVLLCWTVCVIRCTGIPHFTEPSTDYHLSTSGNLVCTLNDSNSNVTINWMYSGGSAPGQVNAMDRHSSTLGVLRPWESSGVYQCVFNDPVNGWTLRRNIILIPAYFDQTTYTVGESDGTVGLELHLVTSSRTVLPTTAITVDITASDGTATGGDDYQSGPYTVTFPSQSVTATLTVPIMNDSLVEGSETFQLTVTTTVPLPNGVMIDGPGQVLVTIADDSDPTTSTSPQSTSSSSPTLPPASPVPSGESSRSSGNIGVVIGPIVVILLLAVALVVVIVIVIWRRKHTKSKPLYDYADATQGKEEAPYYSTVDKKNGRGSTNEEGDETKNSMYYSSVKKRDESENSANNQMPLYSTVDKIGKGQTMTNGESTIKPKDMYAVPDKKSKQNRDGKKERRKSTELKRKSSIEFNYTPHRSPELPVRSQQLQSQSIVNSQYVQQFDLDIYAAPNIPTHTEPTYEFDNGDDPIYSEALNPDTIMLATKSLSTQHSDMLCPYSSIYADPLPLDRSEGPPVVTIDHVKQIRQLGVGQFGEVILAETVGLSHKYLGIGNSTDASIKMKVAVKTLKAACTDETQQAFEKEIKFMSRLKDSNVVRLLGICTTGTPFIMMEYMENGDLNQYLKKFEYTSDTEKMPGPDEITLPALVYIAVQIAGGMKYLSSHKYIHRDLATRNILVGVDFTVKIADFGMSQNLYSAYYYRVGGRIILPIRWMAYECFFGKFSIKTDVWAFGITLWEVFTLCKSQPFYEFSDQQMIEDAIKGAKRTLPSQPFICPQDIYQIMCSCFVHESTERASFDVLYDKLNDCYSQLL